MSSNRNFESPYATSYLSAIVTTCNYMHVYACNYCNYMHVSISMFSRRNDLLVENLCFSPFLPSPVSFKAITKGFPWDLWYNSWYQKL